MDYKFYCRSAHGSRRHPELASLNLLSREAVITELTTGAIATYRNLPDLVYLPEENGWVQISRQSYLEKLVYAINAYSILSTSPVLSSSSANNNIHGKLH